jgi:hypothetical protein
MWYEVNENTFHSHRKFRFKKIKPARSAKTALPLRNRANKRARKPRSHFSAYIPQFPVPFIASMQKTMFLSPPRREK